VADGGDEGQWAGGRRRADGLRRKAEGGRRKEEGGRRNELRMCSYLAGLHLWTTEEFVRREEVGVRFSEVAFCVVAVFWVVRVGVEHSIARC
jgi:hypothetical protein